MAQNTVIQPPPRLTGDPASDLKALSDWFWAFYRGAVLESGLLDPSFQATAPAFDPNHLPDPAATSIAKAQQTANEAYKLAAANSAKVPIFTGEFTLSNTSNQIIVTFATPRADANYMVMAAATDFTASPAAEAFLVTRVTKAATGFTITFDAAPGSGNSITFDIIAFPTF